MSNKKTHSKLKLSINKAKIKPVLIKSLLYALGAFFLLCVIGLIVPVGNDKIVDNEISVRDLNLLTSINTPYKLSASDYEKGSAVTVKGYDEKVYEWLEDARSIKLTIEDAVAGEYQIAIDYLSLQTTKADFLRSCGFQAEGLYWKFPDKLIFINIIGYIPQIQ